LPAREVLTIVAYHCDMVARLITTFLVGAFARKLTVLTANPFAPATSGTLLSNSKQR
jgi:hypothetical protein